MKVIVAVSFILLLAVAVQTVPVKNEDTSIDEVGDFDFYQGPFGGLFGRTTRPRESDDEIGDWEIYQGPFIGIPDLFRLKIRSNGNK